MRGLILSWPEQVGRSWAAGKKTADQVKKPRVLLWAGMGGSAIGGDYCATLAKERSTFPIIVHRGGQLPKWFGRNDRLLAVSFSGNTVETLEAAEEAHHRGAPIDVLTSGGKLVEWANEKGIKPWIVPGERPPRSALGDLFLFALSAMNQRGWIGVDVYEVLESISILDDLFEECGDETGTSPLVNLEFWKMIRSHLPMIYGAGVMAPVARRWACQINENAKLPAHWGEVPEMNHNEVVAYLPGSSWGERAGVLMLDDPGSEDDVRKRIYGTAKVAEDAGWPVHILTPKTISPLARMIEMTARGDLASYYLALDQGIDPTPIEPIDQLKKLIS